MSLASIIGLGLKEIAAHKFRSLLTMLGIILGVSSLVAMSALVTGMERGMKEALIAVGGLEKVRVEPQDVPVEQRHLRDQAVGVTLNDVRALERSAPLVTRLSPEMRLFGATVTAQGKRFRPFICSGVWPVALEMNEHVVAHGRMFNEIDDEMARNVCVIGTATRDGLFGDPTQTGQEIIPVGETIYINTQPFTIIGMFTRYESEQERKRRLIAEAQGPKQTTGPPRSRERGGSRGNFAFWLKNATIYMPLNTMWMKLRSGMAFAEGGPGGGRGGGGGGANFSATLGASTAADPRLTSLELKIAGIEHLSVALQQIHNVLMSTHKGVEDFTFRTQEDWAENITNFIRNARMSGGLIAGISLLVGGIGIMNIMLASISERVREIGIRKAVGAAPSAVFLQILVESVVLAVLGGLAGLATSFALVQLLSALAPSDNTPVVTFTALGFAFAFSVGVGILAGLFPAFKASRLDPIQALRYE